jgi:ABC-type glycerol-3-phosphate transport system permease component
MARRSRAVREAGRHLAIYAGLAPFVLIAILPIVWMAITAFKEEAILYILFIDHFIRGLTGSAVD